MKKQTLKSLSLNRKTVSNLETLKHLQGGENPWWLVSFIRACPPDPTPAPPEPTPASVFPACNSNHAHCPM